jgi:tripartite-type tricarboxylate transporter receptor subunit TctC
MARIVFIALLHFYGCYAHEGGSQRREVIERDLIFIAALCYPENGKKRREKRIRRGATMQIRKTLLAVLCLLSLPALSAAQNFPDKPIKLIVPFPAGGPNDIIARLVGQRMSELTRQPVVIDNRGGQAGVLGTDAVAKAAPDGYTIGIVSASALVINPSMEKVPYDIDKDFAPVTLVVTVPEMLVVAGNVPAGNMAELVALAKAQPGKLNFASAGVGGLPHLAGELFKLTAKVDIVHVPYRGAAPAINDLLGQQVQMTFLDLPVILPHIRSGSLRPIALGAAERAPTAPDVPTTAEVGMPDLRIENWYGMIAPGGTPPAIVASLNRIATTAMNDPGVKQKLADQGLTVVGDAPEHFRAFIGSEFLKWAKVIKDAGLAAAK